MAGKARKSGRAERRSDALSRERIVEAAIELLDSEGESGLTFRALATHLSTGAGALYWHVANKDELLVAAVDDVVGDIMSDVTVDAAPADTIRAVALGLFDAIDTHPWVGAQLARDPGQPAMLLIFERFGAQLKALRVPTKALFSVASTLVNYVLGVASQNAANARNARDGDRDTVLATVAERWAALDPAKFPFMRLMAEQLRSHDDREQFLEGIDLVLAGIASARVRTTPSP